MIAKADRARADPVARALASRDAIWSWSKRSCACGSGRKYKACCLDLDQAITRAAPAGLGSDDPGALTLVVPTPGGLLVTNIRAASPLNEDEPTVIPPRQPPATQSQPGDYRTSCTARQYGS